MDKRILGILLVIPLLALFGCTTERIYDCSKCDTDCSKCDTDCSKCTVDCSKCGPNVDLAPMEIKSGITMLNPSACTDELCRISETKGWASEVGVSFTAYNAPWAQQPVVLMYTEDSVMILSIASKMDFMKGVCDFVNSTKACTIADQEFENAKAGIKTCLAENGLSLDTVAFYYSDTCPHCAKMKPWVEALEDKGYKFFRVNYDNQTNMQIAQDCYGTILKFGEGVPQFACPSNGDWQIGAFMSEDEILKFSSDCVTAAGG